MDLFATAKDLHAVLGLLFTVCRGTPDNDQQVQHFPSACADGSYDDGASGAGRIWHAFDRNAVSGFRTPPPVLSLLLSEEIIPSRDLFIVAALEPDRLMVDGLRLLGQMIHPGPRALGLHSKPMWDHRQLAILFCYAHTSCRILA